MTTENQPLEGEVIVAPTVGNKIGHSAKAIAALMTAILGAVVSILATVPADFLPAEAGVWINTGIGVLTAIVVWLVSNGPKVGAAIDTVSGAVSVIRKETKDTWS